MFTWLVAAWCFQKFEKSNWQVIGFASALAASSGIGSFCVLRRSSAALASGSIPFFVALRRPCRARHRCRGQFLAGLRGLMLDGCVRSRLFEWLVLLSQPVCKLASEISEMVFEQICDGIRFVVSAATGVYHLWLEISERDLRLMICKWLIDLFAAVRKFPAESSPHWTGLSRWSHGQLLRLPMLEFQQRVILYIRRFVQRTNVELSPNQTMLVSVWVVWYFYWWLLPIGVPP